MRALRFVTLILPELLFFVMICIVSSQSLAKVCHPMAVAHCGLPWPSDTFTQRQPNSATGLQLQLPDELVAPGVLAQLPNSVRPSQFSAMADGFSAGSAVLFEVSGLIDPNQDLQEVIEVYDRTLDRKVPIQVSVSRLTKEKNFTYLEAYPLTRWQFAHRYTAILKNNVRLLQGQPVSPAKGLVHISPLSPSWELQDYANFLSGRGLLPADILSITSFTVRSQENVTQPLREAKEQIAKFPHIIENIRVIFKPHKGIAAFVYGSFEALDFRNEDRGITYREGEVSKTKSIRFALALPESAADKPAPVAIYSHGLGFYKEGAIIQIYQNAAKGYATLAIDHPYHGANVLAGDPYLLGMLAPRHLPSMVSLSFHITVDHLSLVQALQNQLHVLDVLPQESYSKEALGLVRADSIPDLDTKTLVFQGISLGGVMGSAFVSMAPLQAAWFQVSGVGISRILAQSVLWKALFQRLVPKGASLADVTLAMSAYQILQDYGDGLNFLGEQWNSVRHADNVAIGLVISKGDKIVPYETGLVMARLLGLDEESSAEGKGQDILVDVPAIAGGSFLEPYTAHFSFIRKESREALGRFLENAR